MSRELFLKFLFFHSDNLSNDESWINAAVKQKGCKVVVQVTTSRL